MISESSSELNALLASIRVDRLSALVVSATHEFVTYVGGTVIYVGDQSRCMRWRSAFRYDEAECWDILAEEITYGSLRKLSRHGMG